LLDDKGEEVNMGNFIIKPDGWQIPEEVAKIHGITQEIAERDGVKYEDALMLFLGATVMADTLAAHNFKFDSKILEAEYIRHRDQNLFQATRENSKVIDTMLMGVPFAKLPGNKWPKLNELHQALFGTEFEGAHNALYDTRACAKCLLEMQILTTQ
jgi:DNA polymerase-3 subunit alpha